MSAFVSIGKKFGKFGFFSVEFAWRYRSRTAMWPWYQVYGDFFKNVAKLPGEWEKWDPLNQDCLHGGVRFMTPEFTIISDRPEVLKHDEHGRLHCENGPAVRWRDGMEQYYWHGTVIPDSWITHKDSITPDIALKWPNTEQRMCAMQIVGYESLLKKLGAKLINRDDDPMVGELYEVDHEAIGGRERFLRVQCGTGRHFSIPVPRDMKTALQANSWTWGLEDWQYKPEVRT